MLKIHSLVPYVAKRCKKTEARLFAKPVDHKKRTPQSRALEHFDDFYKSVFGSKWPGIRAGLLTENKYAAIVNNFGDPEATKQSIEYNGAVNLRNVFEVFKVEEPYERDTSTDNASSIEQRLDAHLASTQSEEIRSIYQKSAEVELEKLELEKALEPARTIDVDSVVDYKKSLQQSLAEDAEYDFDRMISSEIGVLGLQEFIPATKLKGMDGFVLESDHYRYYNTTVDFPLKFEVETAFEYPKTLDIYVHPKSDISRYSRPKRTEAGVASHFLLDGASVLPPLMLNVSPGDVVLDACSSPGGKSLVLLQTMQPEQIVCNDKLLSRCNRIGAFYKKILPDFETKWLGDRVLVEKSDILYRTEFSSYDKALVDVPCTSDRSSVNETEGNIYSPRYVKERLQLPEVQSAILTHCLRLLKPGGTLVFSTCTLSPIQNDGVVNMALRKAFVDHKITVTIKDMTGVLRPMQQLFHFMPVKEMKFGQLILPNLLANYGPMYLCKIQRNK